MKTLESLPTLTSKGWIDNPIEVLERVFLYYITTHTTQGTLYSAEERPSIKSALQTTSNDPEEVADRIRSDLETLIEPYFLKTEVKTTVNKEDRINVIHLSIEVTDTNEAVHKLGKRLDCDDYEIINFEELLLERTKYKVKGLSKWE